MVEILLSVWGIWCGANLLMFAIGLHIAKYDTPTFDGFRICIPEAFRSVPEAELAAAIMHEYGHMHHLHVWWNLVSLLLFMPVSQKRRMKQELEADDFVLDPASLAAFLRRTSVHPFDLYRASRLEERAKQLPTFSGRPYARDERALPTYRGF